jgi:hypothetical protein
MAGSKLCLWEEEPCSEGEASLHAICLHKPVCMRAGMLLSVLKYQVRQDVTDLRFHTHAYRDAP